MGIAITLMSMALLMTAALLIQKRHYHKRIAVLQKKLDEKILAGSLEARHRTVNAAWRNPIRRSDSYPVSQKKQ